MRRTPAIALLLAAGCGIAPLPASPDPLRSQALGPAAIWRCTALQPRRDIPVLCATALPSGAWTVRHQTLRRGRREYLCNLEQLGPGPAFHALAGGRAGRFSLRTTRAREWPRTPGLPRDLGLVGSRPQQTPRGWEERPVRLKLLRRATIDHEPALVLRATDYPFGGIHGGHLVAVWNEGTAGYTLSLHFAEDSTSTENERIAALLQAAAAMRRF